MPKKLTYASLLLNILLIAAILLAVNKMGGLQYLAFKIKAGEDATGVSAGRADHFKMLDNGQATGKIIFVGDSITEMAQWAELFGNSNVINRGIGGDTTSRILSRIESVAGQKPAKIFLMAGINDLVTKSPRQVFDQYSEIVTSIRKSSPETQVVIQSTLPVNNSVKSTKRDNNNVTALNELLSGLAKPGSHIEWFDLRPVMSDEHGSLKESFTFDGIHLNGAAYQKWKEAIAPLVNG